MIITMVGGWVFLLVLAHLGSPGQRAVKRLLLLLFIVKLFIVKRVVARAPWTVSSLDIRRDLHWLPVSHRINFKLCLLTWKTLHTARPPYLSELITHYLPPRALRSSNTNLLARPTGITSNFTSRAFSVSAPSTWNSLPTHIRSLDKLSTFKRQLKSHLFQSAFAA